MIRRYTTFPGIRLKTRKRWVLTASRSDAVIHEEGRGRELTFVERIENPEGRLSEEDMDADKPGRCFSTAGFGTIRHSLNRRNNHHEQNAKQFARRIARNLEVAEREGRFNELVVAAEPRFLSLLRQALPASIKRITTAEINRRYGQDPAHQLRNHIFRAIENRG